MAKVNITKEIELVTGKTVTVHVEVEGLYDSRYGADADGNRGVGKWLVDGLDYEIESEDELNSDELEEVDVEVENLVYGGDFDFETASNDDDEEGDLF